jgi:hypothetical protein
MHRRAGKAPRHDVLMELPRSAGPSGRHTPLAPLSLPPAQPQPPQHTIQPPAAALPPPSQAPGWPLLLACAVATAVLLASDAEQHMTEHKACGCVQGKSCPSQR